MKRFYGALMFLALSVFAFSLSGCGGNSNSFSGNTNTNTETVKQVAVLTSPAFEIGKSYQIYRGSTLNGMNGSQYYIANVGSESNKATLNLGFINKLGNNETLVFVDNDSGNVVFAYDPSGTDRTALTTGTVTRTGGSLLSYNGLSISSAAFFTALDVDTSSAKTIILNGTSATIDGIAVNEYDYVWHADPDHSDEYYTLGLNGETEYTKKQMKSAITDDIYIAHDVIYMPSGLEYTATVKDDDETEYAAYYSSSVQEEAAAEFTALSGDAFGGPYIFATLPGSMGGAPGGGDFTPGSGDFGPGGDFTPGSGDFGPGGNNPPDMPSGDRPPFSRSITATSYNSQIASTIETMTHTSSDAYANPVLHITKAGVYSLQGTWNGQIWIDVGEDEGDNVAIILNGVTVTCTVAPAIVFKDLHECGHGSNYDPDADDDVTEEAVGTLMKNDSADVGRYVMDSAGAMVIIADDTTNNFTGANVYRMLKLQAKKASVTAMNGTDISQQKKRYKMDGAFYSFVSLAIGGGSKGNGVLNITSSTYEGLDTEMHLTVESGTITINAPDDAINVNEDNVSVFTMLDGSLTITSEKGDGIDSNGYVAIIGGSLDITAGTAQVNANGEGGIDAEKGTYISSYAHYAWHSLNGGGDVNPPSPPDSGDVNPPSPPSPDSGDVNPPTPTPDDDDYTPPSDADETFYIETSRGTTTFNMASGSTASFIETDEEAGTPRDIASSGNVFKLVRKVNTFSHIK